MAKTFAERTSAADKWIGFDYQYYYFIDKLLNMKMGESIGLEVLDDVHAKISSGRQLLFQLKHTIGLAANGSPVNLTSLDSDLWKTMSNWASVISDPLDNRAKEDSQLIYVKKSEFHLVTNKSDGGDNQFVEIVKKLHSGHCEFGAAKKTIEDLRTATQDLVIKQYIENVLKLSDSVLEPFFAQLHFELNSNEILKKIRQSILEKAIAEDDVDEIFERLDSNIRTDNFINIKAGTPIYISFDDFMDRYRKIFTTGRKAMLKYYEYNPVMPDNLLTQPFVVQLIHIGDVGSSEIEQIAKYTIKKMQVARHMFEWHKAGQLMSDEITSFHKDVVNKWENSFRKKFRPNKMPPDIKGAAVDLLDDLRELSFAIDEQILNTELSNGELYNLSDLNKIGWHPDWEK